MVTKKWAVIFGLLIIASLVLAACPAPTPEVQTVVQTVVVKETVVETVKETVEVVQDCRPGEDRRSNRDARGRRSGSFDLEPGQRTAEPGSVAGHRYHFGRRR